MGNEDFDQPLGIRRPLMRWPVGSIEALTLREAIAEYSDAERDCQGALPATERKSAAAGFESNGGSKEQAPLAR